MAFTKPPTKIFAQQRMSVQSTGPVRTIFPMGPSVEMAGSRGRLRVGISLVPDRQKYVDLLQGAVADNPYLVVLLLSQRDERIGVVRLFTSKPPFSDSPQAG
jgi:hypothetical protein